MVDRGQSELSNNAFESDTGDLSLLDCCVKQERFAKANSAILEAQSAKLKPLKR